MLAVIWPLYGVLEQVLPTPRMVCDPRLGPITEAFRGWIREQARRGVAVAVIGDRGSG